MKSDEKVMKAIEASESFVAKAKEKEMFSPAGGLTIWGCEVRNIEEMKMMLGQDKRRLNGRLRELYQAI